MTVRVLVVEDHPVYAAGLVALLDAHRGPERGRVDDRRRRGGRPRPHAFR